MRALVVFAVMAASSRAYAIEAPPLPKPRPAAKAFELVTIGPGSLVWGRHGHIALCGRFADPALDRCYHYALGDFAHPASMVAGYFRGTRSFWAGPEPRSNLFARYSDTDRSIWVQELPFDDAKRARLLDILEHDILEDNRYYSYDHFVNNCTTRIRDILDELTDYALSTMDEPTDGKTFRDLAREGFYESEVLLLVLDVAMGPSTDRVPTYYERMFLPQYMREAIAKRFGVKPVLFYERKGPPPPTDGGSGRTPLALIIMALAVPAVVAWRRGRFERLGLGFAVVPYVLLGTVLAFLALISPLPYVRWNEAILVLLPSDLLLVVSPARFRRYARARVVMLGAIAFAMVVGICKQPLWAPLLWPLIANVLVGFVPRRD